MYEIRFLPRATKFLKKIKDKSLLQKIQSLIDKIVIDPNIGERKTGDLSGMFCCELQHNRTDYRVAYTLRESENKIILVVMVGTRENFYEELKNYMRGIDSIR